jgi:O-methyltransferase
MSTAFPRIRSIVRNGLPRSALNMLRLARDAATKKDDVRAAIDFWRDPAVRISRGERTRLLKRMFDIGYNVSCPHTHQEILRFVHPVLTLPPEIEGVIVEAGCYKGGSTSKLSLVADLCGRDLVVFDSFEGIPPNEEAHKKDIYGNSAGFKQGDWKGAQEEVQQNITANGSIKRCRFVKGWFDDTLPHFKEKIAAVYLDVDLVSSTKTCLQYFYPLLQPGGVLCSQDGHLPLVLELFNDSVFWRDVVGVKKPPIEGFGKEKVIRIRKPAV